MSAPEIQYSIRRSGRAQRVRVTVDAARGVEVVLPPRGTRQQAAEAVSALTPWIERRLRDVARQQAQVTARGDTVPYLGEPLVLVRQPGRVRVHRSGSQLLVPADAQDGSHALELWYRREAREQFTARADRACELAGLRYTQLTVRGQRTRWGSCTQSGALSFNWRLLLAPEPALDYVVWHEVCHLSLMDHSSRFWELVARHCPSYREQAAWLRRHGATLVL